MVATAVVDVASCGDYLFVGQKRVIVGDGGTSGRRKSFSRAQIRFALIGTLDCAVGKCLRWQRVEIGYRVSICDPFAGAGSNVRRMDSEEFFERMKRAREVRVRYGRANLTVARWGGVAFSKPLVKVLDRWRNEGAPDDEVAWTFIRERVLAHTASFSWDQADLTRLVRLVTEVSNDPEIKARSAEDLAPELSRIEEDEQKSIAETNRKLSKAYEPFVMKDVFKGLDSALFKTNSVKGLESVPISEKVNLLGASIPEKFDFPSLSSPAFLADAKALQDKVASSGLLGSSIFEQVAGMQGLKDQWADALAANKANFAVLASDSIWKDWSESLAQAARAADQPDVADAVEATGEFADEADDADADVFVAAVWQLGEALKVAAAKAKSPAEQIAIHALATVAVAWLVYYLAQLGIHILPPEQPPP